MFKKIKKHNGGEMEFGMQIILFILVIFIIWILMGGHKKEQPRNMLIVPKEGQVLPLKN